MSITTTLETDGVFTDERAWTADNLMVTDCSGGDCGLAELYYGMSFPCQVAFTTVAEAE